MTDDPNENNWCDHGYCQLAEMAEQSRKNLARIESYAATIARLEGERDEARANADVYAGFNDSAEAKVAALVEALERIAAGMVGYSAGELARAALAAAKEGA